MEHTPTLSELQLRIDALEQEKKHLLKLVSHDVKSPFNKLFALSNLLQLTSDNLGEEQQEYLLRMEWVIKEGLTVVRNLMDLRAIESNEVEIHRENLDLNSLAADILNGYKKQIGAKKLILEEKINKVTIQSDKRMLERILDHLISNAVKFSPLNSNVTLKLNENKSLVHFSVSSNSGPIPDDEISKLFQKNTPLSIRPTHGESALGNGLFIAQTYANKLGGNLKMEQKENSVEFEFSLPLKL